MTEQEKDYFVYPDLFTTSDDTVEIIKALLVFNEEAGIVSKSSKNPFFKSDYADLPTILSAIKDPMTKAKLTINHFPIGDNRLISRLSHESGQFFQAVSFMKSVKDTPQDRGSVITYMMRYAVGAHLGLSIDKDDDGNKSTGNGVKTQPKQPVLKTMTVVIKDTMLDYIEKDNITAVEKQLPKYNEGANKTLVKKALLDAKNLKELDKG